MSTEPVLPELPPGRVQIGLTPPFKEVIYGDDAVRAIQAAAFKAGREHGIEEAAKKCASVPSTYHGNDPASCAAAIRSMAEGEKKNG